MGGVRTSELQNRCTALHHAAETGLIDCMRMLIDTGSYTDATDDVRVFARSSLLLSRIFLTLISGVESTDHRSCVIAFSVAYDQCHVA